MEQLKSLLIAIGPSKETTFEINPESLSSSHLSLFREGLVTRVSIGIQSFNDNILKILGRGARKEDNLKALDFCKSLDALEIKISDNYFVKNNIISREELKSFNTKIKYSFDLMTSLPTQTLKDSINDINILNRNCNLKHLSLYCLSVEEGTELYSLVKNKKVKKNSDLFEKDLMENIWLYLSSLGFEHYEISSFQKDDNKCLHNLRYWNLSPYISLGSSSASTIYDRDILIRLTNTSNKDSYIKGNLLSDYEEEELTKNQFLDEYILSTLRSKEGLNFSFLHKYFNINKEKALKAFKKVKKEYYKVDNMGISLTQEGFILLDTIILDVALKMEKIIS